MGDATLYTVLPTHTADAGITLAAVGIILGVNRAIRLLTNGPAGLAYDRFRRRPIFLPALFLGALSTAVYAATTGFWPLLLGRLLWGLAWSGIWVGGATMILDVTTGNDRGRWTGLYQTWFFLGSAFGAFAGGLLTDRIGYAGAMWAGAAATTIGGIVAALRLPETRSSEPGRLYVRAGAAFAGLRTNGPLLAAVSLQGINRFVGYGVLSATLALLVQQQMKGSSGLIGVATLTGLVMSGRTLFSMAAAPLSGRLSDAAGNRWGIMAWMVLAGLVGILLMIWGPAFALVAGIALTAVSGGGIQALATAVTGDVVSHEQRGRAIGLLHTSGDLGSALGPPVAYALLPVFGLAGAYLACALLLVVGLATSALLWLQPRLHRPADDHAA
jgi:MFS family permease